MRMMRTTTKTLLVAATLCLAAAALAPRPSGAAETLTLMLDWFVNPDHAPLFVALEKGYFAEAGLEVELHRTGRSQRSTQAGRRRQGGPRGLLPAAAPLQVAEGLPLVRVATLVATPLQHAAGAGDGPVRTIADLKGRTVGYSVGGFEDALLGAMLGATACVSTT